MRRTLTLAIASLGALLLCMSVAGAVAARSIPPIAAKYAIVSTEPITTTGAYTFFQGPIGEGDGTLLDEKSMRRIAVPTAPGCSTGGLLATSIQAASWLMLTCGVQTSGGQSPAVNVYPIPDGPWRTLAVPPACQSAVEMGEPSSCTASDIGRFWAAFESGCYHCETTYEFQNLASGQVINRTAADANTFADLNAPNLSVTACSAFAASLDGSLIADDGFVIRRSGHGSTLIRCGRPASTVIDAPPGSIVFRPHLLLWKTNNHIIGMFLPSQRRFQLGLPSHMAALISLALSLKHVYISGTNGNGFPVVWQTPWPKASSLPAITT